MSHANLKEVTDGMAAQRAHTDMLDAKINLASREDLKKVHRLKGHWSGWLKNEHIIRKLSKSIEEK